MQKTELEVRLCFTQLDSYMPLLSQPTLKTHDVKMKEEYDALRL